MRTPSAPMSRASLVCALAVVLAGGDAVAGNFQVQPTRLDLAGRGTPTELTISNHGQAPARFEAKVFVWNQDEQGVMQLAPTKDIVVYPTLFTIEPGAKRAVRVAATSGPAASERSYRIFVEELPAPRSAPGSAATAVAVRTRMGVPIFVAPSKSQIRGAVEATVRAAAIHVAIHNRGTVHAKVTALHVVAKDAAGAVVFDQKQSGWYVLAGGSRRYKLTLDASACQRVSTLLIEAASDGVTWKTTAAMPRDGCAESK
jgi:fimbrial chaperone protein